MSLIKMRITPCGCLPVKGGTICFAIIACLLSFSVWITSCISLMNKPYHSYHGYYQYSNWDYHMQYEILKSTIERSEEKNDELWQFIKIVFLIYSLVSLGLSIFLLHGVIKEKAVNMVPWLSMQFGILILIVGFNFAWLITGHYFTSRFETMIGHMFGLFVLTMYIYIFMVLYSYYQLLIEKKSQANENSERIYHRPYNLSFVPNAPVEV